MTQANTFVHQAFYAPQTRIFVFTNNFLAALTLVSVLALILETVPRLSNYLTWFQWIEYTAVFFFTLEYLLRISANRKQVGAYVFSFFGLIDLLAITPTLLGFSNLTFLKTARILRILQFLRMIRLAKLARFGVQTHDLEDHHALYRLNIEIYFFALFCAITIFGTLIFIIEGTDPAFASIPLGMLWALKPLMGGVAQIEPSTILGEMIAVSARFVGLILFGLLIAIIGNSVKRLLFGTPAIE